MLVLVFHLFINKNSNVFHYNVFSYISSPARYIYLSAFLGNDFIYFNVKFSEPDAINHFF